jgi:hypothetical protein
VAAYGGGRLQIPNSKFGKYRGGSLQLHWAKCAGTEWCLLDKVDLTAVNDFGVFVVWRPGDSTRAPAVLYVGNGSLRHEIAECRRDPVLAAAEGLRITWAEVDPRDVAGVAVYLYQQLRPLWGEVPQPVPARPVNLPLQA